jgi:hypothetical protein
VLAQVTLEKVEAAGRYGVDISKPIEMLEQVNVAMNNKDYITAFELAKQAQNMTKHLPPVQPPLVPPGPGVKQPPKLPETKQSVQPGLDPESRPLTDDEHLPDHKIDDDVSERILKLKGEFLIPIQEGMSTIEQRLSRAQEMIKRVQKLETGPELRPETSQIENDRDLVVDGSLEGEPDKTDNIKEK